MTVRKKQRGFLRYFIPRYDEVALFAMSLTSFLVLAGIILSTTWNEFLEFYQDFKVNDLRIIFAGIIFFSGFALSIYHAFTDRPKSSNEKFFMLFFAVCLNAMCGLFAGAYELRSTTGWLVIFPVLNIINAVILLIMIRTRIIDEENIADENASLLQIIFTAAIVLIMFFVCTYMYRLIWIQTLSICVIYATNLGRSVQPLILSVTQKN